MFGILFSSISYAQTTGTLILSDKYDQHYLSPYFTMYDGISSGTDVREIVMGHSRQKKVFSLSNSIYLFDKPDSISWMSFKVKNTSEVEEWIFDFGSALSGRFGFFKDIEIYHYNLTTGEIIKILDDVKKHIPINIEEGASAQILLKFSKSAVIPASMSMRLIKSKTLINNSLFSKSSIIPLLLIGFIFSLLGLFFANKSVSALSFIPYYSLLFGLYVFQDSTISSHAWLLNVSLYPLFFVALGIVSITTSWFFWGVSNKSFLIQRLYFLWSGLVVVIPIIGMVFLSPHIFSYLIVCFVPTILSILFIGLTSVFRSQNEDNGNIFYMLGWFVFAMGSFVTILSLSSVIQPIPAFLNAHYYALVPQFVFFMLALHSSFNRPDDIFAYSRMVHLDEDDSVNRLRETKENTEQQRLLKVIEQERKVMGELRKSEARRAEEMRVSKEAADEANRAKSAFLAVVSHEIRTPMTGIMGMVRLLLNANLSREQKEQAQTIQDSSDAMLALLNDILDFEKIEQGKMMFENISFDLPRLFRGVTNLMNGHAVQKEIKLEVKLDDNLPRYVRGDMARLRQVLLNLIGNAIKFTDQGSVTVTAQIMQDPKDCDEKYEVYFGVKDSGIGISKIAQQNLFNPFSQADSSISRKFGGTGLGLAISRGLVEGMGSTINISSNEGEGSTFFFTLTMEQGYGNEADKIEEENRQKIEVSKQVQDDLTILVVDDNVINQSVIEGFLKDKPYTIDTAGSAEEAIYKLDQRLYNLVLMDIELPGMNGDEATKKIRSGNDKIKDIPIIALTGNIMPDDIAQYKEAGMNDILSKPIDVEQLNYMISSLTSQSTVPNKTVTETRVADNTSKKLIVKKQKVTTSAVLSKPTDRSFNPETLDTLKGHLSADDLRVMVNDVIVKSEEIIGDIQNALKVEDLETLSSKGHELKGMAGNFGLMELSKIASDIEIKSKTDPVIVLSSFIDQLSGALQNAKKATEQWMSDNN